ncbi:hypothetical protein jhhlp_000132 [Lomentospora prolificans]|uniref:Cyclin N-terminal domain-containing protein n=1 Tax=Lomentospora prolificans TaxID=41688 RepID=A0A2N3NLS9_9PEZI|nr:hypothetical protein jhhlp_000132 [Lomentospora prolificans]
MCSISTNPPNTLLPSPPVQAYWSCGQRAKLSTNRPQQAARYSKPQFSEGSGPQRGSGHSYSFGGLKTPPTDDMSAACHQVPLGAYDGPYDSHHLTGFPPALAQGPPTRTAPSEPTHRHRANHTQQQQQPTQIFSQQSRLPPLVYSPRLPSTSGSAPRSQSSTHSLLPSNQQVIRSSSTPRSGTMSSQQRCKENKSACLTGQSSEIPDFICAKGGSLPDLVAQMTCFFWFEPIEVLRTAETFRSDKNVHLSKLSAESIPQATFTKWVHNILSTTQVTRNVILLALLFIYRLKRLNPAVRGRAGSEYRLLTVALMLGNKFLDDNTYTNKTWADVSYISVEFLSNMRYSLLTTEDQWEEWLDKLGAFYDYYEAARTLPSPTLKLSIPSPTGPLYSTPLASPTVYVNHMVPTGATPAVPYPALPSANGHSWVPVSSPLANRPNLTVGNTRKRSIDSDLSEPPSKRMSHGPYSMPSVTRIPVTAMNSATIPTTTAEPSRRSGPVPTLTINTQTMVPQATVPYAATASTPNSTQPMMSLPPLVPGVRAMASVYQQAPVTAPPPVNPAAASMAPQLPTPHSMNQAAYLQPQQQAQVHQPQQQQHHQPPTMTFTTPTKNQSSNAHAGMYNSSPLAEAYGAGSVVHTPVIHTPISHSPSIYLQQRPSPYKPVRHVNTLLYPPPSASLEEYHLAVPPQQMHYHPLGRRNDLRTGIVPDFIPYRGYQGHTPVTQPGYP